MDSKQPEQPGHERIASQKDATDAARLEAAAPAAPGTHAAASVEVKQEDRAPLLSSTPTLEPFVAAPDAGSVHLPAAPHKGFVDSAGSEASLQNEAATGSQSAAASSSSDVFFSPMHSMQQQQPQHQLSLQDQHSMAAQLAQYQLMCMGKALIWQVGYGESLPLQQMLFLNQLRPIPAFASDFLWLDSQLALQAQQQSESMKIAHCGKCYARLQFPKTAPIVRCPCGEESYVKLHAEANCASCKQLLRFDPNAITVGCPICKASMHVPPRSFVLPDTQMDLVHHDPDAIRQKAMELLAAQVAMGTAETGAEAASSSAAAAPIEGAYVQPVQPTQLTHPAQASPRAKHPKRKPANVSLASPEPPATPTKKSKQPFAVQPLAVPEELQHLVGKKPTRPLTARQHYWKMHREQFKKLFPRDTLADLNARMTAEMEQLQPDMIQQWDNIAASDRERYERELLVWNEQVQQIVNQHAAQAEAAAGPVAAQDQPLPPATDPLAEPTLQQQSLPAFLSAQQHQFESIKAEEQHAPAQQQTAQELASQLPQPQSPQVVFPLSEPSMSSITEAAIKQPPAEESEAKGQEEDTKAFQMGEHKEIETHTQQG